MDGQLILKISTNGTGTGLCPLLRSGGHKPNKNDGTRQILTRFSMLVIRRLSIVTLHFPRVFRRSNTTLT